MRFDLGLVLVYFILTFLQSILIPLYQLGHTGRKMMGYRFVNGINSAVNGGKPLFIYQQMTNLLRWRAGFMRLFLILECLLLWIIATAV